MSAPCVVLLHGVLSGPATFDRVRRRLEDRGLRVLAPALPGHAGRPTEPDATTEVLARRIAAEVPTGALVVGHSLGAVVALHLAALRPDLTGVVAEDPPTLNGLPAAAVAGDVVGAAAEAHRDPEGLHRRLLAANPSWTADDAAAAVRDRAALDAAAVAALLQRDAWDLPVLVRAAPVPVVLLAARGPGSALTGPERGRALAAADRSVEIDSGHAVHRDRPDEWVALVAAAALGSRLPRASARQSA